MYICVYIYIYKDIYIYIYITYRKLDLFDLAELGEAGACSPASSLR